MSDTYTRKDMARWVIEDVAERLAFMRDGWETRTDKWVKLGENDDVLGHITWDKLETILNLVKLKHFDDIRVTAYDKEELL